MRPLGSNCEASVPAAQTIASGANSRSAGRTTSSKAAA